MQSKQLQILKKVTVLTEGEKEGGLAVVALTIGEENVKGAQGGVEAAGLSWKHTKISGMHTFIMLLTIRFVLMLK